MLVPAGRRVSADVQAASALMVAILRQRLEIPAVLRRETDAYRGNDPLTVAESYAPNARLVTHLDEAIARLMGLPFGEPVIAVGSVGILRFYAYDMMLYDVKELELIAAQRLGREIVGTCNWKLKCRTTGVDIMGFCQSTWTLDTSGRKFAAVESAWQIYEPDPYRFIV